MSNPDDIQGQAGEARPSERASDQPMDTPAAIGQLRALVCGLGVALLIVSLVLSAFILKQNRNIAGEINTRQTQISQLRANRSQLAPVINELAKYSVGKPELTALFLKHGIQITTGPATTGPATTEPVQTPAATSP